MADIGWRRWRGSSPAARTGARQRAGLTPASASNTLSCQRETLHSQQLKSIKNPLTAITVSTAISEMSSQIIPLKGRTDLRESSRIPARETTRV